MRKYCDMDYVYLNDSATNMIWIPDIIIDKVIWVVRSLEIMINVADD